MLEKFFDKQKTCRACTNTDIELSSIFVKQDPLDEFGFSHMITECTALTVPEDDELPQLICSECKAKVRIAFNFKKQYEESQKKLLNILHEIKKSSLVTNIDRDSSIAKNRTAVNEECKENFRSKLTLNTIAKKFSCEKCHQIFANSKLLNEHVKEKHNTLKHACSICSKEFIRLGHLTRHVNKVHKKESNPEGSKEDQSEPNPRQDIFAKTESTHVNESKLNLVVSTDSETERLDLDFCSDNDDDPSYDPQEDATYPVKVELEASEDKIHFLSPATKEEENLEPIIDKKCQDVKTPHLFDSSRRFQCDQCHKAFKRKSHLKQHSLCHTKIKPYQCTICQKKFGRPDNLKVHMSNHGQKQFQCNSCDRSFGQAYLLKRHKDQTHSEEKPFLCSICGQTFVRNGDLAVHMRRHTGEKPYKCQYCNKGFTRSTEVYVHERYHTGEKRHVCSICGKAFQRPYNLLVHVRTHTGERPYQCPHCPKNFAQCSDLKAHIRRHTGERYRCDQCGVGFIHVFVLNQHKLSVHGIEVQSRIKRVAKLSKDTE